MLHLLHSVLLKMKSVLILKQTSILNSLLALNFKSNKNELWVYMQVVLEEHIPGLCWVNGIVHPAHESCCHVSVIVELFDMDQLSHKDQVNSYLVYTLSGQCQLSQFQNLYHKSSCRKNRTLNFSTP